VPRLATRAIRRALGRHRPPPWIDPGFAARINLADRLAQHESSIPFPSYEQYDTWHESTSGSMVHGLEMVDRATSRAGVEDRHPFFDRRIIEFGLAMPPDQRWRDGRAKDLLRRAAAAYVPATVADRLVSPAGTQLIVEGIQTEGGAALVADMAAARLGWIRQYDVRARFDDVMQAMNTPEAGRGAVCLWHILALELWAKAAVTDQTVVE
jgi:asparagine synthase (glutamine-hydrolysing)